MTLVYISNSFLNSRRANSIHVVRMSEAFSQQGMAVTLLAPDRGNPPSKNEIKKFYGIAEDIEVVLLPCAKGILGRFIYIVSIFTWILKKNRRSTCVYSRFLYGSFLPSLFGYKTIIEVHKPFVDFFSLRRLIVGFSGRLPNVRKLVVISDALATIYKEKSSFPKTKIIVAHDGAKQYKPESHGEIFFPKKKTRLDVGYVGHLYHGRGIDIIIDTAANCKDVIFHIAGGDDIDISFWKRLACTRAVENIKFYGFIPPSSTADFMRSCDILVAPYQEKVAVTGNKGDTSGYMSPLKIFEYMAVGRPIVCSDLPVLHEVLSVDEAIFVKPTCVTGWSAAIRCLADASLRQKMGDNCRSKLRSFSWCYRANSLVRFFE